MFQNTIEGLNLEASEELGLHTKWLWWVFLTRSED